jgi:hypothetical protein
VEESLDLCVKKAQAQDTAGVSREVKMECSERFYCSGKKRNGCLVGERCSKDRGFSSVPSPPKADKAPGSRPKGMGTELPSAMS